MDGDILYVITATVLLAICLVILVKSRSGSKFSKWFLAGYFVSSFLVVSITYFVLSPYIIYAPHFFRTGTIPFYLVMPFSWFYFRNVLTGKGLGWFDLVHLIPLCIYLVDYAPFFMLSGSQKLDILLALNTYGVKGSFAEGWFMPKGGHVAMRYSMMAVYWIAQWRLLHFYRASAIPQRYNWLNWMLYAELLIFLPALFSIVLGRQDYYIVASNFSGLLASLIQGCVLLMKPEIVDLISMGLARLMDEQQRFRKPDLKLYHLAEEIGVPLYKLSAYFNQIEHQIFFEYINRRRIAYCISKMKSGEAREKTLEAISFEAGFNTRSTFIRAFKKLTGKNPSTFMEKAV